MSLIQSAKEEQHRQVTEHWDRRQCWRNALTRFVASYRERDNRYRVIKKWLLAANSRLQAGQSAQVRVVTRTTPVGLQAAESQVKHCMYCNCCKLLGFITKQTKNTLCGDQVGRLGPCSSGQALPSDFHEIRYGRFSRDVVEQA